MSSLFPPPQESFPESPRSPAPARISMRSSSALGRTSTSSSRKSGEISWDPNYPESAVLPGDVKTMHTRGSSASHLSSLNVAEQDPASTAATTRDVRGLYNKMIGEFARLHTSLAGMSDRIARLERQTEEVAKVVASLKTVHSVMATHSSRKQNTGPQYAPGI